jgi:hypothetical protein
MFNTKVVGTANAFAAGWGNMGGGFTSFIMPLIFDGIIASGVPDFQAWRWAFFVPASFQVLLTVITMAFCQDMPDGNMVDLYSHGALKKPGGASVWKAAVGNYRTWVGGAGAARGDGRVFARLEGGRWRRQLQLVLAGALWPSHSRVAVAGLEAPVLLKRTARRGVLPAV